MFRLDKHVLLLNNLTIRMDIIWTYKGSSPHNK
jgi:hypothetical protein